MRAKIKNFFYFKVLYTYLAYRSITILLLFCLIISFQMSCFIFTIESALFTHIVQCADDNIPVITPNTSQEDEAAGGFIIPPLIVDPGRDENLITPLELENLIDVN